MAEQKTMLRIDVLDSMAQRASDKSEYDKDDVEVVLGDADNQNAEQAAICCETVTHRNRFGMISDRLMCSGGRNKAV